MRGNVANFGSRLAAPYVKASVGVAPNLTVGNWMDVTDENGKVRRHRLAGYTSDGRAIPVPPRGKGRRNRVGMGEFRLACGKQVTEVVETKSVTA